MADDDVEAELDHEDRRHYDRSRLIVDVHFDGTDATGVASTKDISPGGLYMNTQANLLEGAVLLIRIPFGSGKQLVAKAEVIYANSGRGVGLRFKDLSDEDRKLIEAEIGNG